MSSPNIILITCDQMRADAMGCAGNAVVQTPHLDMLAAMGMRFTRAFSCQPVCIPARATILSGLTGPRLGIIRYQEGFRLPVRETLPQCLKDGGYETRLVGKMHQYPERCHYGFESMLLCEEGRLFGRSEGENRGYDDYELWLAEQGHAGMAFGHGMSNNEHFVSPWHLADHLHPTEWIGTEACKAIKRRDWTRPLFLWASFTAPHPPLTPLARDLKVYERSEMPRPAMGDWTKEQPLYHQRNIAAFRNEAMTDIQKDWAYRGYYAMITQVDRQINRLLGTLRDEGLLDRTWIVFASDHGDSMGDHGLWHKTNFLQGSCQIPLIIVPPPRFRAEEGEDGERWLPGATCDSPVGLQDLLPTLLAAAGVAIPQNLDGHSLLSLLTNPGARVREHVFGEFGSPGRRTFLLSDGEWKYIRYEEDGRELLFAMSEDPDELHDRSAAQPEMLTRWRGMLLDTLDRRATDSGTQDRLAEPSRRSLTAEQLARMVSNRGPHGLH